MASSVNLHSTQSAGRNLPRFATKENRYLKYLETEDQHWPEVGAVKGHLQGAMNWAAWDYRDMSRDYHARYKVLARKNAVAVRILDTKLDNTVEIHHDLLFQDLIKLGPQAPDDFDVALETCDSEVHSRIILVQMSDWWKTRCIMNLFVVDSLAMRFGLQPALLFDLLGEERHTNSRLPFHINWILLGLPWRAHRLGKRKFGSSEPFSILVFSMGQDCDLAAPFGWLGLYHASGPNPDPMSLQHGNTSVSPGVQASIKSSSLSSTTECFTTLISSGDWRLTVSNTASARTHWLGTMLAMVLAVTSGVFRTLEFKVKSVRSVYLWQAEPSSAGLKRTWMDTKKLLENLQECFMQLQAIKEDQPLATIEDISSRTTAKLQRLIDRARSSEAEAKDRLGTQVSMKSIEMAEQSIQESKRVKLLTILAFFFIPISLATSIFGMNVQEINETGKQIWTVVTTAVVLIVIALSAWRISNLIVRARDNRRQYRALRRQDPDDRRLRWVQRSTWERMKIGYGLERF